MFCKIEILAKFIPKTITIQFTTFFCHNFICSLVVIDNVLETFAYFTLQNRVTATKNPPTAPSSIFSTMPNSKIALVILSVFAFGLFIKHRDNTFGYNRCLAYYIVTLHLINIPTHG